MATLHRAVTLAKSHVVAVVVGEHLHLDVARAQHELLEVHPIVAERRTRLGAGCLVVGLEVGRVVHFAHALAAAACRSLDEHRIADFLSEGARLLDGVDAAVGAGHRGDAAGLHGLASGGLVAHALDALGGRPDEYEVVVDAGAGEVGVFSQEAVAGMDRLGAGNLRRLDDVRHHEIAFIRLSRSDANLFVSVANRVGVLVCGRVNRHGLHPEFLAGTHDAQRNFPAIGDENLLKHYDCSETSGVFACGSM